MISSRISTVGQLTAQNVPTPRASSKRFGYCSYTTTKKKKKMKWRMNGLCLEKLTVVNNVYWKAHGHHRTVATWQVASCTGSNHRNRPFAQLWPGLETGHPVTVGQSPAYDFSVSDEQKVVFLVSVSTVLCAIHVQVTDRPSPDAPSLTQAIIVQMVYSERNLGRPMNSLHKQINVSRYPFGLVLGKFFQSRWLMD